MTAVTTNQPRPASRPNLAIRWERAGQRARIADVHVSAIDSLGTYRVTSASHLGVTYESDGVHCTCQAAANGDPVCLHRAAVRDHINVQKPYCAVCNGTGVEHISIWDWKVGCAATVSQIPCQCAQLTDLEPDPPAPSVAPFACDQRELADAIAALSRIDALLIPFNRDLEFGDGAYCQQHSRKHDALLARREIAQQRVWNAEDAVRAMTAQVAA